MRAQVGFESGFSPPWCHGGLSDDDFTISVVPIRRPRTEAAYEPRKLPTFDLHATGPPIGVPTGTPPRTPEAANLRIEASFCRCPKRDRTGPVEPTTVVKMEAPLEEGCCGWVGPRLAPRVNS